MTGPVYASVYAVPAALLLGLALWGCVSVVDVGTFTGALSDAGLPDVGPDSGMAPDAGMPRPPDRPNGFDDPERPCYMLVHGRSCNMCEPPQACSEAPRGTRYACDLRGNCVPDLPSGSGNGDSP